MAVFFDFRNAINIGIQVHKEEVEILFSQDEFNEFIKKYKKEDIAAAIQKFLEEFMLQYIKKLIEKTFTLCMSVTVCSRGK